MTTGWFADQLNAEGLSQGDIVSGLLFTNAYPTTVVQKETARGGGIAWRVVNTTPGDDLYVVAKARIGMGIVTSHSCELDKKAKGRFSAAPLAPFSTFTQEDQRQAVLEQRRLAFFPIIGVFGTDYYADLRGTMPFDRRAISDGDRKASMTEEGLLRFQAQLARFDTRRELLLAGSDDD